MGFFAIVMLLASISMIRNRAESTYHVDEPKKFNYLSVFLKGITLGIVTGMVGAGGGFLIIPSLFISARMAM